MCTGDNLDTAKAISRNAGILGEGEDQIPNSCLTGQQFREIVGTELKKIPNPMRPQDMMDSIENVGEFRENIYPHLRVLARSSPKDKLILVTGVQQMEGVVAVTGDGTNDAPALTQADVGFSMGITGTDIAKGASDIILLDDNFTSIITALMYGRNVYDSVRKFLQFQLSVNLVSLAIVFTSSALLSDSPLNAVQLLWTNLIMDTLGALALATETPKPSILERQPYGKYDPIISKVMKRNVFGHSFFQIIVLGCIIFALPGNGLVQAYWYRCTAEKNNVCTWNPYFTKELWATDVTISYW